MTIPKGSRMLLVMAAVALKYEMSHVPRHGGEMGTLFVAWMLGFNFRGAQT